MTDFDKLRQRWNNILNSLTEAFEACCFFRHYRTKKRNYIGQHLSETSITWLCCDVALVLDSIEGDIYNEDLSTKLLNTFQHWCSERFFSPQLNINTDAESGS